MQESRNWWEVSEIEADSIAVGRLLADTVEVKQSRLDIDKV